MKTIKKTIAALALTLSCTALVNAQENVTTPKPSLTVLNVDIQGALNWNPQQMGNLVRMELEKLDTFEVMDRYDVSYVISKNQLKIENCYGKKCLVEIGNTINSDKMFTGSVELFGEKMVTTFRIIDVKTARIEKTQVNEYLNIEKELPAMIQISIKQMFGLKVEQSTLNYLSKKNSLESSTNNNDADKLSLAGPRSGFTYFTGETGRIMNAPRSEGGYNAYPMMFQFGYQFEIQYLNEGNYQALFEFIPTVTGFTQNIFIPSIAILNGFRNNKNGWEIAFGPTLGIVNTANGYYTPDGTWHLADDWKEEGTNPYQQEQRIDSRGNPELHASFLIAVGKTFKSGRLNIPVNLYFIPSQDGYRFGLSLGFNAKKKKMETIGYNSTSNYYYKK